MPDCLYAHSPVQCCVVLCDAVLCHTDACVCGGVHAWCVVWVMLCGVMQCWCGVGASVLVLVLMLVPVPVLVLVCGLLCSYAC